MQLKEGTGPSVFGIELCLLILEVQESGYGVEGTEADQPFVSESAQRENSRLSTRELRAASVRDEVFINSLGVPYDLKI
jgi:hypothetical protein